MGNVKTALNGQFTARQRNAAETVISDESDIGRQFERSFCADIAGLCSIVAGNCAIKIAGCCGVYNSDFGGFGRFGQCRSGGESQTGNKSSGGDAANGR